MLYHITNNGGLEENWKKYRRLMAGGILINISDCDMKHIEITIKMDWLANLNTLKQINRL